MQVSKKDTIHVYIVQCLYAKWGWQRAALGWVCGIQMGQGPNGAFLHAFLSCGFFHQYY